MQEHLDYLLVSRSNKEFVFQLCCEGEGRSCLGKGGGKVKTRSLCGGWFGYLTVTGGKYSNLNIWRSNSYII